jgi:CBS domain-containing protein
VSSGATANQIGQAITAVTDAITLRLLELAEAELGAPPVPYCWMAGGSQARREQSSHSDQDNALLIADHMRPEDDAYFAACSPSGSTTASTPAATSTAPATSWPATTSGASR